MNFSKNVPVEEGLYWYKSHPCAYPKLVEVYPCGDDRFCAAELTVDYASLINMEESKGMWSSKLEEYNPKENNNGSN